MFTYEPLHEKTCLWGLQPGKTQTGLLLKPACSAIESSLSLEILDLASIGIIISK